VEPDVKLDTPITKKTKEEAGFKPTVNANMILHGRIGVSRGYLSESGISCEICGVEEQFEVHHVINNNLSLGWNIIH